MYIVLVKSDPYLSEFHLESMLFHETDRRHIHTYTKPGNSYRISSFINIITIDTLSSHACAIEFYTII